MPPPGLRAKGGRVGEGKTESAKHATPVQHTPGKDDGADIGRKKPITYRRGGGVKGVSVPVKPVETSPVNVSKPVMQRGPAKVHVSQPVKPVPPLEHHKFHGGSKSGVGRLEKAGLESHKYP